MSLQLVPGYSSHRIFLEEPSNEVIEVFRKVGNILHRLLGYRLEHFLERALIERHLASCHFVHDDAQRPEVGEERQHTIVLEQLGSHVVDTTCFLDAFLFGARSFCGRYKVGYLF